jgi:hypothetical protein
MFELLSHMNAKFSKFKIGLKANYTSQTIAAELDESS